MKSNRDGFKNLNVRVPVALSSMIKKLAIDEGTTVTELIIKYLEYLQAKPYREKKRYLLNEDSSITFPDYPTNVNNTK